MKIAILGHSYVRDLQQLGYSFLIFDDFKVPIEFFSFPGFCYRNFVLNPNLLDNLVHYNPEVTVVFLGGNDIKVNVDLNTVKADCEQFFCYFEIKIAQFKICCCSHRDTSLGKNK